MKKVLCGLAVLLSANIYALEFTYQDGWDITFSISNLKFRSNPYLIILFDSKTTNTGFAWDSENGAKVHFNIPDGTYKYAFYDSDKNLNEAGVVTLTKPLVILNQQAAAYGWKSDVSGKKPQDYQFKLLYNNEIISNWSVKNFLQGSIVLTNLRPDQDYQFILSGDKYQETIYFKTLSFNIALGKPVWGTFSRLPDSKFMDDTSPALMRINDGIIGWYKGMAMSEEIDSADQMAFINLGDVKKLRKLKVYWHASYCPIHFYYVYSINGSDWSSVERLEKDYQSSVAQDSTPLFVDTLQTNLEAQYIGVLVKKGEALKAKRALRNYLGLVEIEAYE